MTFKQTLQKKYHDCGINSRNFQIGDAVFVKNQTSGPKGLPGQIQEVKGPLTYTVLLQDGCVMKRHVDQICSRTVNSDVQPDDAIDDFYPLPSSTSSTTSTESTDVSSVTPPPCHSSNRIRNPPDRYVPDSFCY